MSTSFISLLLTLCVMLSTQTGTIDRLSLIKNYISASTVESYTTDGTLKINLTGEIDDETKNSMKPFNLQSVLNALSDFEYSWKGDMVNKDNSLQSSADFSVSSPDLVFNSYCYMNADDKDFNIVYQIPTVLRPFLPEKYENAKYASSSSADIKDKTEADVLNLNDFYGTANDLIASLLSEKSGVSTYIGEHKDMFKKSGNTYTVNFTDETLKGFSKEVALEFCNNEKSLPAIKSLTAYMNTIYKAVYPDTEDYASIFKTIDEYGNISAESLYANRVYITNFFDYMKDIKILGDKGLIVNITLDKNSHITNVNFEADISVNFNQFNTYETKENSNKKFIINALVSYNNNLTNINKTKVSEPKYNKNECASIKDWLTIYTEDIASKYNYPTDYESPYKEENFIENVELPAQDGSITYFIDSYKVDFGEKMPTVIDGVDYFELESLINNYIGKFDPVEFSWDSDTKTITVAEPYSENYSFKINTNIINYENYSILLPNPIVDINGNCYVPVKSFMNAIYKADSVWDGEKRSININ